MALTKKEYYETWTQTITSECKWTLYDLLPFTIIVGEAFMSPEFSSCINDFQSEFEWQMHFYLNGCRKGCEEHTCIFLIPLNEFEGTVDWTITISTKIRTYQTKKFNSIFKKDSDGFGACKHLEKQVLIDDLKKGSDTLTVIVKIISVIPQRKNPQLNLIKNLKSLLKMEKYCDLTLISNDGSEHKAHKSILTCRSTVFSAMFQHNTMENQNNTVNIEDVDKETLKAMLHFVYTGEIENIQENAKKLLVVADKYELDDLQEICSDYLCGNIKTDNVLDFIEFAHTYNICTLKLKTKEYFLKNRKEIMLCAGQESLKNLPRCILDGLVYDLALMRD